MKEIIVKVRPKIGTGLDMSSAAYVAEKLVTREEARTRSKMRAYDNVAAQVGRSGDWLRKLIRDRTSSVKGEIERRLNDLLVRGIEADIARLTHELEMARQSGAHPCGSHIGEVEAHLAAARALLTGGPMSGD